MEKQIAFKISWLQNQFDVWMRRVCHYQTQLQAYSDSTSSQERSKNAFVYANEIDQYIRESFQAEKCNPPQHICVLYGFWSRLDTLREFFQTCSPEHYLVVSETSFFGSIIEHYLTHVCSASSGKAAILLGRGQIRSRAELMKDDISLE